MRRGRINTHNPVPPLDPDEYIELAPHQVREALEAYDKWTDKRRVPPMMKELMLVLSIEVERLDNQEPKLSLHRRGCAATHFDW